MDITVLTLTYNRATLLPRLYESLKAQTFEKFEWLILDDGSTDNTREIVESWEAPFPVRYVHQPNGGQKVAWNRGLDLVRTDYVATLESDDLYLPNALEMLIDGWKGLGDGFVSVNGRTIDPDGNLVGTPFTGPIDTDSFTLLYRHRIHGDTVSLARTDIVRRYPFPYPEVRGGSEATAFNRVARRYKIRFLDEPVAVKEYQLEGLTARSRAERMADPRPWLLYYWEAFTFPRWVPLRTRAKFGLNCLRFGARRLVTPASRFE